jgi:hypothetical protein
MFRAIVATQWKWTRSVVLLATLAGFALPLASLQTARNASTPQEFIGTMQAWGAAYALLAGTVGLLVALAAWGHDHQGRHVYALSLPISRPRYALLRFSAGTLFLLAPTVAVLLGSLAVALSGAIPEGLHAFPFALTLRFLFAAAVAYALFFSIGSGTTKTAGIVLGVFALLLFGQYLLGVVGARFDLLSHVADFLFIRPGVLSIFSGRWMLVDV